MAAVLVTNVVRLSQVSSTEDNMARLSRTSGETPEQERARINAYAERIKREAKEKAKALLAQ